MSVSVNCWYCSEDSLVPAQSRDSWECPKCDQFNSFTPDGDVTTAVAAAGAMQRPVRYNVAVQPAGAAAPRWQLCHQCNLQQQLKTRQLAAFRPVIESRWEHEMEEYERHLDKVYQPCTHCQAVVASALREADDRVRPAWLAWLQRRRRTDDGSGGARAVTLAHSAAASRLSRAVSAGVSLVLPAGQLLLLLLLGSSGILTLWPELMPAPLLELQDALSESRSALLVLGFSAWVLTTSPGWRLQTLASLALWTAAGAVEALVGPYISDATAAQLQVPLVTALLLLSVRTSERRQLPVRRRVGQHVTDPAPASSTPKPECNGSTAGGRHGHGAISNGHGPLTSSGGGDSGLPSPIMPSQTPPAQTPTTADHDYNLPRLSLGSPRRPPGSSGVFALRTYQPTGGGALFSGGRSPAAPLLSPSRLRGELHRSSWIAGGYWQRGQPAPPPPASPLIASRTSSQSSGFVDAFSTLPPPEDERHDPRGWGGSQCDVRSCAGDTWVSCAGSQRPDWRGWPGDWRGGPAAEQETIRRRHGPASGALDSSSLLSDRSGMSQGTVTSGMTVASVSHRSLLVALVLGFSMAFNLFAVLLLVYRDRL